MRSLLIALSTLIATSAFAEPKTNLTVLLSIDGRAHEAALAEMKAELKDIMKDAGKSLDIRMRSEARPNENFEDVVLVKLKGNCSVDRLAHLIDERGPLAFTHSTDGAILPFAEVACDRLATSVARALFGEEKKHADKLLGRAIGRVLAHELYHILGKTHEHNEDGSLAKEAISAKQLISDKRISFDMRDLQRMAP
jgi:hypothetical protein